MLGEGSRIGVEGRRPRDRMYAGRQRMSGRR